MQVLSDVSACTGLDRSDQVVSGQDSHYHSVMMFQGRQGIQTVGYCRQHQTRYGVYFQSDAFALLVTLPAITWRLLQRRVTECL